MSSSKSNGPNKLSGKVAIITGAAGGIGQAIVRAYAEQGCAMLCTDIDGAGVEALAMQLRAEGLSAFAVAADIAKPESAGVVVAAAMREFGRIDILVNNAAYFPPEAAITDLDAREYETTIAVNLGGAVHMCRAAIPFMKEGGGGVIVNVASQLGSVGKKGQAYYCASKGALIAFSRALALDCAASDIRVVSLSPGGVATQGMAEKWGTMENAEAQWGRPKHPLGRLAKVGEIAAAALFLASDDASFITGTDLVVDGGYNAQ